MSDISKELARAVTMAKSGDWDAAHAVVQKFERDELACWLHALVHKVEGDDWNARYWYRRTDRDFDDFDTVSGELDAIAQALDDGK